MRLSSLSIAVAVAVLGLPTAHAAEKPTIGTSAAVDRTAQARALGFDQVDLAADGRQNVMVVNATTSRSASRTTLRAGNLDQVIGLLQGQLGAALGLTAGHSVQLDQFNTLADGRNYYRMTQTYRGVPVFGDNITVQTDATGGVEAVFGAGIAIGELDVTPRNNGRDAILAATNAALQVDGVFTGARNAVVFEKQPQLVVYALFGHAPTLAWEATVSVETGKEPFRSRIFADASSGALLNNITLITHAINRRVFDANSACFNDLGATVPVPSGVTLKVSEGGSTAGQITQVVAAYESLGNVYWYFKNNFGRDSYNNTGGRLDGYVRASFQSESCGGGQNAFWDGSKMVMGRGGSQLRDLAAVKDVTYHEIGHGVTEYTSGLIYQKEPGGLNEASSDIWGAAVEAFSNTFTGEANANTPINYAPNTSTWTIGDGLFTNGNPLRYMNDPARDGSSADEYSDYTSRWGNCSPTANNDSCGVHSSSGIANLAFYLLSQGGTHPRNATTINVTPIGIAKAAKYVYEAHASASLSSSATFTQFRNAMQSRARANSANGGLCDEVRIAQAWAAVEVTGLAAQDPNACGGGPGNTAPVANFSSSTNGLTATFTDSSTDSDGTIASRSWNFGDGTTSTATNPSKTYTAAGTYTVTLTVTDNAGATNSKTGSVTVGSTPPGGTVLQNGVPVTGLTAAVNVDKVYTLVVPAGATNLKFVTSGGTGDVDIYAKAGSAPTTTSYTCRSEGSSTAETCTIAAPTAGTYYVLLHAYAAYSGVTLTGSYTTGGGGGTQTYTNTADFSITDNATINSPIVVSGRSGNAPSNASVTVAIDHTYQGDLKVDLVAPDGTLYNIHNRTGSGTDDVRKTVTLNLSSEALNGTWNLRINDNGPGDVGTLESWSITF